MVPAWNAAFSVETNCRAWTAGGFGPKGITLKPLWDQKKVAQKFGASAQRALSRREMRRRAIEEFGLAEEVDFEKALTALKVSIQLSRPSNRVPSTSPPGGTYVRPLRDAVRPCCAPLRRRGSVTTRAT